MQPRTPLRLLLRHGEERDAADVAEPDFPLWAGIWSLQAASLDELFGTIGLDEKLRPPVAATVIGPQQIDEYLPFLIAFRQIIESELSDEAAIRAIGELRLRNRWAEFIDQHGGAEALLEQSGEPRRSPAA